MNDLKTLSLTMHRNQGLSLIELLISMTLGLSMLAGLMSMYLGSKNSDLTRTELSNMDANATVALKTLRKTIQLAGYGTVAVEVLNKSFYTEVDGTLADTVANNPLCRDGKKLIVSGLGANSGLLNPPEALLGYTKDNINGDVLTVIYRPDSPDKGYIYADCATSVGSSPTDYPDNYPYGTSTSTKAEDDARLVACSTDTSVTVPNGMHNPKDAKVYSAFFLDGNPKQLQCYGSRSRDAEPYIIADNIENIQYRYAVRSADKTVYKKADDITEDEWKMVNSVQVAILVGSENRNVLKNPAIRKYQLLDMEVTKSALDKRMYKVYSMTIYLHNIGMR
jgi:type IV pilus assembly protein PilW